MCKYIENKGININLICLLCIYKGSKKCSECESNRLIKLKPIQKVSDDRVG